MSNPRRPILAACLILVVFATGGLGITGGRVICIGAQGHVAVAGAHDGPEQHDCCHEGDDAAADHEEQPCTLTSTPTSDCTDWSLDAQHAQRSADDVNASPFHDFAPLAPHLLTGGQLGDAPDVGPSCLAKAASARIPRAHLAPLASVILLI